MDAVAASGIVVGDQVPAVERSPIKYGAFAAGMLCSVGSYILAGRVTSKDDLRWDLWMPIAVAAAVLFRESLVNWARTPDVQQAMRVIREVCRIPAWVERVTVDAARVYLAISRGIVKFARLGADGAFLGGVLCSLTANILRGRVTSMNELQWDLCMPVVVMMGYLFRKAIVETALPVLHRASSWLRIVDCGWIAGMAATLYYHAYRSSACRDIVTIEDHFKCWDYYEKFLISAEVTISCFAITMVWKNWLSSHWDG